MTLAADRLETFRGDRNGTRPARKVLVPIKTLSRLDLHRVHGGAGGAILGGIGQAASGVGGLMGGIGGLLGGIGQLKVAKAQANAINGGAGGGGGAPAGGGGGGAAGPAMAAASAPGGPAGGGGGGGDPLTRITTNVSIA